MTQRIFEAVLAGCLPLTPAALPFAAVFTPPALHVATGTRPPTASPSCRPSPGLPSTPPSSPTAPRRLGIFRLSRQLPVIETILRRLTGAASASLAACPAAGSLGSVPMERIAIIGCGGSGKSHLARVLGARLGITPVHLDAVYYDKDWKPLDQEAFAALQRDLVAAPRWIIDGNYASTLPIRLQAADTVIFLDLPGWACLWGIVQRRLRHGGGQHQAIGVYDRITWDFIRYILGYRKTDGPARPRPDRRATPGTRRSPSCAAARRPPLPGRPRRHGASSGAGSRQP